ncbi:MAG: hypothetical protein IPP77_04805 [Bacteroidetes bacterium]|nr:hypothetical protein [Bacteroidota bacterium]
MCFSAEMSFGAGVVLTTIGVITTRKAKPNQVFFACIPLLFGIQQITEGFIWVIHNTDKFSYLLSYLNFIYLFFAFIIWPIWIPFSILKLKGNTNEKFVKFALGLGIIVSLSLGNMLFFYKINSEILCYHIKYSVTYVKPFKYYYPIIEISYLIAISLPAFLHNSRSIKIFSVLLVFSYFMSKWIYTNYFTSVWCFFAAIISIFVYYSLSEINSKT